jgi:hypothetical protein
VAPARPDVTAAVDAATPPGGPAAPSPVIDLTADRTNLRKWTDAICACKDKECAASPSRDYSIWEKELILQRDVPDRQPYVTAVEADAVLRELRQRYVACSRKIKW